MTLFPGKGLDSLSLTFSPKDDQFLSITDHGGNFGRLRWHNAVTAGRWRAWGALWWNPSWMTPRYSIVSSAVDFGD